MIRRANRTGAPAQVSAFRGPIAQTRAARDALNSPAGQAALARLDANPAQTRVPIHADVTPETIRSVDRGNGFVLIQRSAIGQTTVIVDVRDRTPGAERIHIQTCYMK